jgi:ribosomal protein S18 acetylase RimI-like enzyme
LLSIPQAMVFVDEAATTNAGGGVGRVITGAVSLRVFDTPSDPQMVPQRRGHIDGLVVAAGHRRRGIGRHLMEAASAWAKSEGAEQLVLTVWAGNAAARAFYDGLGYGLLSEVLTKSLT